MTCKTPTKEIQKTSADQNLSAPKTKKTVRKKSKFKVGLSNKDMLNNLTSNISIAKGLLATLSLRQKSDSIKKLKTMETAHLQILLLEVMEEICTAEETLFSLSQSLSKRFAGICSL